MDKKLEALCIALMKGDGATIEHYLRAQGIEPGSEEAQRELARIATACSEWLGKN